MVLDTNALVRIFGRHSRLEPIKHGLVSGRFVLAVSTPVLLEYEEVICRYAGRGRWEDVSRFLTLIMMLNGNVQHVSPTFRFRTISHDADDDAFADCAITAEADYIVTSDHHFDSLTGSGYKPQPITPEDFIQRLLAP